MKLEQSLTPGQNEFVCALQRAGVHASADFRGIQIFPSMDAVDIGAVMAAVRYYTSTKECGYIWMQMLRKGVDGVRECAAQNKISQDVSESFLNYVATVRGVLFDESVLCVAGHATRLNECMLRIGAALHYADCEWLYEHCIGCVDLYLGNTLVIDAQNRWQVTSALRVLFNEHSVPLLPV